MCRQDGQNIRKAVSTLVVPETRRGNVLVSSDEAHSTFYTLSMPSLHCTSEEMRRGNLFLILDYASMPY